MSKSWKAAESRIGIWYGAKGIKASGRQPLSGGNSGVTRGDSPHETIFIESKRDKSYHSVILLYREYKSKSKELFLLDMPVVEDGKVISKHSDIVCFHHSEFFNIVEKLKTGEDIKREPWKGLRPRALTLYEESVSIKNSTSLDRDKKAVTVNLVYHGCPGFYIVMNINDILTCENLILEARVNRERLLKEEEQWAADAEKEKEK